jgi:hypothetical protein
MAWERRETRTYYYRSVRTNGQVTKEYVGTGLLAELAAAADAERQAQRQADAGTWRQARTDLETLDAQVNAWWNVGAVLIKAVLYTEGYYRHDRGTWRKRAADGRGKAAHSQSGEGGKDLAQTARRSLVKSAGGEKNLLVEEVYDRQLTAMAQDLAGLSPSPLERLLVERIVLCWLHLYYAEAIYVQNMQELSLRQAEFHQQRITKAYHRYLSAMRTLAQVRRLGVPAIQVHSGEQQVNVAQ